jgi:hypothetical protein
MSAQLIKYEAACRALAECKSVDEVKTWADKAAAMQAYGRMAKDKTLEVDAAEIRIRAERRLGEMLAAQKADGGLNKGQLKQGPALVANEGGKSAPRLADVGIGYDLSSRAQKLAAVPEAEFEAELAAKRERDQKEGARVTARLEKAGERELAKEKKQRQPEPANDADTGQSIDELIAEIQKENEQLHAQLKAMEADDTKAELRKALLQRDHAVRQQSEAMDKAHKCQEREKWAKRQLMRCGKAVGEEDPDKIAAAVEAFIRQYRKAA